MKGLNVSLPTCLFVKVPTKKAIERTRCQRECRNIKCYLPYLKLSWLGLQLTVPRPHSILTWVARLLPQFSTGKVGLKRQLLESTNGMCTHPSLHIYTFKKGRLKWLVKASNCKGFSSPTLQIDFSHPPHLVLTSYQEGQPDWFMCSLIECPEIQNLFPGTVE